MAKPQNKNKKKKNNDIELTPAEKFVQLQTLKRGVRCMLVEQDVYDVYVKLTKDFADLAKRAEEEPFEGCEECLKLSEECAELAEEWKKTHSTERVVESRTVTTSAKERENYNGEGKKGKGKWIVLAAVVLVVGVFVCLRVDATKYQMAKLEQFVGFEDWAKSSYEELGDYKDCKERISVLKKEEILKAKKGASVKFGTVVWEDAKGNRQQSEYSWIVLDKKGKRVLLTKKGAIHDMPYHDADEKVTWESCSLRKELNSTFYDETFSDMEKKMIEETPLDCMDNETYGTKGGSSTKDKIFIMNEKEVRLYREWLGEKLKIMRLRTPGKEANTTTYISALGQIGKKKKEEKEEKEEKEVDVVDYGFPVNRGGAYIRPTMWVNCE